MILNGYQLKQKLLKYYQLCLIYKMKTYKKLSPNLSY